MYVMSARAWCTTGKVVGPDNDSSNFARVSPPTEDTFDALQHLLPR